MGEGEQKEQNKASKEPAKDVDMEDTNGDDEIASGRKSIFIRNVIVISVIIDVFSRISLASVFI